MTVAPHLPGYPRIGPDRELKRALEGRWAGRVSPEEFEERRMELRAAHLGEQWELVGAAADDFFLYDQTLETALMYGLVPDRVRDRLEAEPFQVLTELARGTPDHEAWEMTKWFDTNYHLVVPEIEGSAVVFRPLPWRVPNFLPADGEREHPVTWVALGPYSLLKLSKVAESVEPQELASNLGAALWAWVREQGPGFRLQVDEPCLGLVLDIEDQGLLRAAYEEAGELGLQPPPLCSVQFGRAGAETVEFLGRKGFSVQLPLGQVGALAGTPAWEAQPELLISVMDGRSVWPDDFGVVAEVLGSVETGGRPVRLCPSTSLMFLPYTVEGEELPEGFQFAREKARTLREWATALEAGRTVPSPSLRVPSFPEVGEPERRASRGERRVAQKDIELPLHPTTTTGSLPQTPEVRKLRARYRRGEITLAGYQAEIDRLIVDAIRWQEERGLDVLVHGEFERTDMVEYFAEQMEGYHTTEGGWVVSYGSRCVRPPILAAPPSISSPMTVREWQVAQAATDQPVKGMMTGPVTIVNWSFRPPGVPDDRLFWAVAQPIRQEVDYLVEVGARIVQIDEPAVRERWPLPTPDAEDLREVYARGVRAALARVFCAPPHVQMHTHMCYGDFGDIVPLWEAAGVDVASIEYSRSKDDSYIRQFYELYPDGHLQIGPGLFDVHSPHSPGEDTMAERLRSFREVLDPADLWANPDCGLKTRRWEEIETQIRDLVAAARALREEVG